MPVPFSSSLPGDPASIEKAAPAEYRLRSTGRVIINLNYVAEITIRPAGRDVGDHCCRSRIPWRTGPTVAVSLLIVKHLFP